MPSTVWSSVVIVFDSSTVMTPSLPTFFIASAMMLPMVESPLAEMVPTWAIMSPRDRLGELLNFGDNRFNGLLDAALQRHRVRAGGNGLHAFAEDRLRQNGRGGGAVTGDVGGLRGNFAHHLRAHVLERILQLDFFGDGDAVLGDRRAAELLLEDDVAALGAEGHFHRVGNHRQADRGGLQAEEEELKALVAVAAAAVALARGLRRASSGPWNPRIQDDRALADALRELAKRHRQPALAAALVRGGDIVARAAVGRRVQGQDGPVEMDDRFHLGSTTKALTSLLVGILVREGKLGYETTLDAALGDLPMRDEYRRVTLADLLLSRGGIMPMQETSTEDPAVVDTLWREIPAHHDRSGQRLEMARVALDLPPIATPGTKHVYSNVGWGIAGLVAETAAGESYESLLESRIFGPLGMKTARVGGWPASTREPDQPRGHYVEPGKQGTLRPQPLDDEYVFPDWMSPAGGVHCSIGDFALFARETLLGLQGKGMLLDEAGYRELHSVHATATIAEMYGPGLAALLRGYGSRLGSQEVSMGYGWGVVPLPEGMLSAADGSGGTFFARIVVFPALDAAFVGATTTGAGAPALDAAIETITGLKWS